MPSVRVHATLLVTLVPPGTLTVAPTPAFTPTPAVTPGPVIIGPASLDGPDSGPADTVFYVNWVGPNNTGHYVTIVAKGKRKWNDYVTKSRSERPSGSRRASSTPTHIPTPAR